MLHLLPSEEYPAPADYVVEIYTPTYVRMAFEDRLAQLADYKKKHNGNCNVHYSFKGYGNLGKLVARQRINYNNYYYRKQTTTTIDKRTISCII